MCQNLSGSAMTQSEHMPASSLRTRRGPLDLVQIGITDVSIENELLACLTLVTFGIPQPSLQPGYMHHMRGTRRLGEAFSLRFVSIPLDLPIESWQTLTISTCCEVGVWNFAWHCSTCAQWFLTFPQDSAIVSIQAPALWAIFPVGIGDVTGHRSALSFRNGPCPNDFTEVAIEALAPKGRYSIGVFNVARCRLTISLQHHRRGSINGKVVRSRISWLNSSMVSICAVASWA